LPPRQRWIKRRHQYQDSQLHGWRCAGAEHHSSWQPIFPQLLLLRPGWWHGVYQYVWLIHWVFQPEQLNPEPDAGHHLRRVPGSWRVRRRRVPDCSATSPAQPAQPAASSAAQPAGAAWPAARCERVLAVRLQPLPADVLHVRGQRRVRRRYKHPHPDAYLRRDEHEPDFLVCQHVPDSAGKLWHLHRAHQLQL